VLNKATNLTDQAVLEGPYPTIQPSTTDASYTTPVVTAFWASRYLGKLEAEFSGTTNKLVSLVGSQTLLGQNGSDSNITPDPEAQALIDSLRGPVQNLGLQIIGSTNRLLEGAPSAVVRTRETNLGDIIADAMVDNIAGTNFAAFGVGPLWLALMNGGGVRASIQAPAGQPYPYNISQNDIFTVLPFGNYISTRLVTGQQLIDALENGVSLTQTVQGRFPQIAGIRFAFSPNATPGARVIRSTLTIRQGATGDHGPLDPAGKYPLATNNFIAAGGDGYASILASQSIYESGDPLDLALGEYVLARSPIDQGVDGRIVDCVVTPASPLCVGTPGQ
jgi:5'-nucleotidase